VSDPVAVNEVAAIVSRVAEITGIAERHLRGHRREFAKYRFAIYWLARENTGKSYPQIAKSLGGRDHSTVISGCKRAEDYMLRKDAEFLDIIANAA
jgi:chromosomal replication initiator protein